MHSLVLITFFFSKRTSWPPIFSLFLLSASNNPSVEFRIVSNLDALPVTMLHSNNIQLIHSPYNDINMRLKSINANQSLNEDYPYKLCDFKPMFADLFPEIVRDFEFWGHVDNDLILGDLRTSDFFSDTLLHTADIVSTSYSMCNGPLQIYRNTLTVNTLYKLSRDLPIVLHSQK